MCDLPVWRGIALDGPPPWWCRGYVAWCEDYWRVHGPVPAKRAR